MPRPKKVGGPPPKTRSRNGCWPCKGRKVKCDETRPRCQNCVKIGQICDYSIKLNWQGRLKKDGKNNLTAEEFTPGQDLAGGKGQFEITFASPLGGNEEASPSPRRDMQRSSQGPQQTLHSSRKEDTDPGMNALDVSPRSQDRSESYKSPPMVEDLYSESKSQFPQSNHTTYNTIDSPEPTAKRIRLSGNFESSNTPQQWQMPPPRGMYFVGSTGTSPYLGNNPLLAPSPFSPKSISTPPYSNNTPLTPASSSVTSDDHQIQRSPHFKPISTSINSNYDRRLSVESLLASPLENTFPRSSPRAYDESRIYGFDVGAADKDIPENDDENAITNNVMPSTLIDDNLDMVLHAPHTPDGTYANEFGFGLRPKESNQAFEKGNYYASPVAIKIPVSLGLLPPLLSRNPMNLLYFHHFLNHTARILVPHDCSENPFKTLLPQMAFSDSNLLKLLLSYSASHRARLLGQADPANRIALWVQDVFPSLRHALLSSAPISNANLATAIMLTSLEVISPNAFGVPIPWQQHLHMARDMLISRGGAKSVHRHDKISYFLSRWLAYLDVIGSLGGSKNDKPLFSGSYWADDEDDMEARNDFQIDCLLGFTSRSIGILARIAELARKCDIEHSKSDQIGNSTWTPIPATILAAEKLRVDLEHARTHVYQPCPHLSSTFESENAGNSLEMVATNDAFHWAGLIHIRRRILGLLSNDSEVQNAVRQIIGSLYKIRRGGTAEACLLFPMFTAGCEAKDQGQRQIILERLDCIGQFGMTHVRKAKALMKRVWETGQPWETLVDGEFFG